MTAPLSGPGRHDAPVATTYHRATLPPAPEPQAGDTKGMPAPPRRLKDLIEGTVDHHASQTHPDLQEVTIRWRGSFGYLIAWAGEGDDDDEQIPLCRIEYLGDDEDWGFALYDTATETWTPALLRAGQTVRPAGERARQSIHTRRGK